MATDKSDKSDKGPKQPTVIKKYANRRLYHTGTSTYVTLEDLAGMVRGGEDFIVFDAKSSEDITRSVLTQIIFEEENKVGSPSLLPITFLRQLIRFYGDSMQALVPSYLALSMENLARDQQKLREQMTQHLTSGWGQAPWVNGGFGALEEQARNNMVAFQRAFRLFSPFTQPGGADEVAEPAATTTPRGSDDLTDLKKELAEMKSRLDRMSDEKK